MVDFVNRIFHFIGACNFSKVKSERVFLVNSVFNLESNGTTVVIEVKVIDFGRSEFEVYLQLCAFSFVDRQRSSEVVVFTTLLRAFAEVHFVSGGKIVVGFVARQNDQPPLAVVAFRDAELGFLRVGLGIGRELVLHVVAVVDGGFELSVVVVQFEADSGRS